MFGKGKKEKKSLPPVPLAQPDAKTVITPAPPGPPLPPLEPPPSPGDLDDILNKASVGKDELFLPPKISKPTRRIPEVAAPLFIKVEKYNEIVGKIDEVKSHALSLRDALDSLMDVEKELGNVISMAHDKLDKLDDALTLIDEKMSRAERHEKKHLEHPPLPKPLFKPPAKTQPRKTKTPLMPLPPKPSAEAAPTEVGDYTKNLHKELERIKREINGI